MNTIPEKPILDDKKKKEDFTLADVLASSLFRKGLYVVLALIFSLLLFRAGMIIGYQKALFSFHNGENYEQIFIGPKHGPGFTMQKDDLMNAHGTIGKIIQVNINGKTFVLRGTDQVERSVAVDDDTLIKRFRETIPLAQLMVDDNVIVIGSPEDSGVIEAKLIRFLPPPLSVDPGTSSVSSTSKMINAIKN